MTRAKSLSPRQVRKVSGEIAYLCSLGQSSQLVVPAVLDRVQQLIPSSYLIFCWMNELGRLHGGYCKESTVTSRLPNYVELVEARPNEKDAWLPSSDLMTKKISYANSDTQSKGFLNSLFYNECLRPLGTTQTARFQT